MRKASGRPPRLSPQPRLLAFPALLPLGLHKDDLLGGSWVVLSGVISPLIWVISIGTPLLAPLITTHEPPSRV